MRSWEGCLFLYDLRHQTCYCYNSISLASSSEKSDMELSEEEERSSWTILIWKSLIFHQISVCTCSPPHWSLKASSVAYFFTYSATFFLYSSGLRVDLFRRTSSRNYSLTADSPVKIHCCCISVERICGVGVGQELGQERLEYIGEIVERSPGLIDDIQTHSSWHLVNVGMIHLTNNTVSHCKTCPAFISSDLEKLLYLYEWVPSSENNIAHQVSSVDVLQGSRRWWLAWGLAWYCYQNC